MLSLLNLNTDIWWPQCIKWPANASYLTITPPCPGSWSISVASRLIVLTAHHIPGGRSYEARASADQILLNWSPLPLQRSQNSDGINTILCLFMAHSNAFWHLACLCLEYSILFPILCGVNRQFTLFVMGMGSGFSKSEWYQKLAPGLQHCCLHWLWLYWQHREEGGCMTWPGNCSVLHLSPAFVRCPFSY